MKKIRYILLAFCMCLCSIFAMGCGNISFGDTSQPIKDLRGTYELVEYKTLVYDGTNKEVQEYDQMTKGGTKLRAYLIVTGGAYGYYVDNSLSANKPRAVKERLYYNMDDEGLKCTSIGYHHKDQSADCTLKLGENALSEEVKGWYGILTELNQDGYRREWEKVSNDYTFGYVKSVFDEEFRIPR